MMTDEIAETVRRAAGAVPASRSDLSAVLRRHRGRRRRAALGAVAVAAVTAVAVTGAVVALDGPQRQAPGTVQQTPAAQAQRLPLDAGWALGPDKDGARVTVPDVGALLELGADQQLVATPVPAAAVDDVRSWVPLQDGRFVALGGKNLQPGVDREDGTDVTGFAIRLLVLAPDGQVGRQREVRVQGEDVQLVGATETTAYLYRTPGRIVAHDLATGAEQRLTALDPLPEWDVHTFTVQGGLLLTASQESCDLTATALDTGGKVFTAHFPDLRAFSCPSTRTARLSPDGRTLAVAVSEGEGEEAATVRLLKIDVATGKVTSFEVSGGSGVARDLKPGTLGVGWVGSTVRVVWLRMPTPGVHPLSTSIQVTDVPQ